jgi:hypothetical protein
MRRMEYHLDNATKTKEKKKKNMIELKCAVHAIRAKYSQTQRPCCVSVKTMCKWKKQPNNATLPTKKKTLEQLHKKTMHNSLPHVSLNNPNAKEEASDASDVDWMDSNASVPENDNLEFSLDYEIDEEV